MIFVDLNIGCARNRNWCYDTVCHLFGDNPDELHALAAKIGLKRSWFQGNNLRLDHYDLTPNKRAAAIKAGAIELKTGREIVLAMDACKREGQI